MDWIFEFPFTIDWNTDAVDKAVRGFAAAYGHIFSAITSALTGFVSFFNTVLGYIPWFVLLGIVFLLAWKSHKSIKSGILYAALLSVVGFFGLWQLMNMTLAIVLAGVMFI